MTSPRPAACSRLCLCLTLTAALLGGCRDDGASGATSAESSGMPSDARDMPSKAPSQMPSAEPSAVPSEMPSPPPPQSSAGQPDARTAGDFATAWATVRAAPVESRGQAGKALGDAWRGRIYTWTGYAVPGLCLAPSKSCALHVFERRTTPAAAQLDGYFPQVKFTDPAYAALLTACKGKTGCVVTFRGALADVGTDPAEPLVLGFEGATFVSGRDPTPEEQWFGRRPGETPPDAVPNARLRTGEPVSAGIKPLQRTF